MGVMDQVEEQFDPGVEKGVFLLEAQLDEWMEEGSVVFGEPSLQLPAVVYGTQDPRIRHIGEDPAVCQRFHGSPQSFFSPVSQNAGKHRLGQKDGVPRYSFMAGSDDLPLHGQHGGQGVGGVHGRVDRGEHDSPAFALQVVKPYFYRLKQLGLLTVLQLQKDHAVAGELVLHFLFLSSGYDDDGENAGLLEGDDDPLYDGNRPHLKQRHGILFAGSADDSAGSVDLYHRSPPGWCPPQSGERGGSRGRRGVCLILS